jgi:hypothetical protein
MTRHYRKQQQPTDLGVLDDEQQKKRVEIHDWLINGEPRSKRSYYIGDLGGDLSPLVGEVRALMWHAMENGIVYLFQRRTKAFGSFEYVAVKRGGGASNESRGNVGRYH